MLLKKMRDLQVELEKNRDDLSSMQQKLRKGVLYWRDLDLKKEIPIVENNIKELETKIRELGGKIE